MSNFMQRRESSMLLCSVAVAPFSTDSKPSHEAATTTVVVVVSATRKKGVEEEETMRSVM